MTTEENFDEFLKTFGNFEEEEENDFSDNNPNSNPSKSQNSSKTKNSDGQKYVPLYVYDGWYHKPPEVSTDLLLKEKLGPTQLKNSIENHYFKKNYQEALRLSLEYVDFVETLKENNLDNEDSNNNNNAYNNNNPNRLNSTREMLEIASRCALKLGDIKLAVKCVDKLVSNEPGHLNLKGMIYSRGGRFSDAIKFFVRYQKIRRNDYIVWKEIGKTFINYSENNTIDSTICNVGSDSHCRVIYLQLALICLKHSYNLMTKSNWQHSIDYLEVRYLAEKKEIEELINKLVKNENVESIIELTDWINKLKNLEENDKHSLKNLDFINSELFKWILNECNYGNISDKNNNINDNDNDLIDKNFKSSKDL